jgi:hypothetical protein
VTSTEPAAATQRHNVGEAAGDGRPETAHERSDRNLSELTGELRVVVTGVQVLFAFLLVVPFDSRFGRLDSFERGTYFATLLLATAAAVCTIAPSAQHRILFRRDEKAYLVRSATRLALAGLVCLALAMCGALGLVATLLFGAPTAAVTAGASALAFGLLWFALPIRRARVRDQSVAEPGRGPD